MLTAMLHPPSIERNRQTLALESRLSKSEHRIVPETSQVPDRAEISRNIQNDSSVDCTIDALFCCLVCLSWRRCRREAVISAAGAVLVNVHCCISLVTLDVRSHDTKRLSCSHSTAPPRSSILITSDLVFPLSALPLTQPINRAANTRQPRPCSSPTVFLQLLVICHTRLRDR